MKYPDQFARLAVASHYAIHVVEADNAVVLYNRTRPLVLTGNDKVRLFQYITSLPDQLLCAADLITFPEEDILLVAQLLQDNILEYLDMDVIDAYAHEASYA